MLNEFIFFFHRSIQTDLNHRTALNIRTSLDQHSKGDHSGIKYLPRYIPPPSLPQHTRMRIRGRGFSLREQIPSVEMNLYSFDFRGEATLSFSFLIAFTILRDFGGGVGELGDGIWGWGQPFGICSRRSKLFSLEVDPFQKGSKQGHNN